MSSRFAFSDRRGSVVSFDPMLGAGVVTDDLHTDQWTFHCTQLDGGARAVPEGTKVTFSIVAGLPGRWEAVHVAAIAGSYLCPVCGASVVGNAGDYDICEACGWEDDPTQRADASTTGANGSQTLSDARTAWIRSLIERSTGDTAPEARG